MTAAIITHGKAACLDIVSDLLKQHAEDRQDFRRLEDRIKNLEQAEITHLATNSKVSDDLCPETFWNYVFIETGNVKYSHPIKKLAQIPYQAAKLWRIFVTSCDKTTSAISAMQLINAVDDYAKINPAPRTFKIAVDRIFAILRLWNFQGANNNSQFQQRLIGEHLPNLAAAYESKRAVRRTHSPDFIQTLLNKNFGSNEVKSLSDFIPVEPSKENVLDAILLLSFLHGNRSPEFNNVKLFPLDLFISVKSHKILDFEGRVLTVKLPILKHKTTRFHHRKTWTILIGIIDFNQKVRKRTIALLPAGKAFLYLLHFKKSETSLLPSFVNLEVGKLTTILSNRVRQIYDFLGQSHKQKSFYSGKNTLATFCLTLKIPREEIVSFIGWKNDNLEVYTSDPTFSLQCTISEFPEILEPLIRTNVCLANKASSLTVYESKN